MTAGSPKTAEQKRQLLAELLKQRRTRVLPASFAQTRLWLLDRIEPDSPHYNLAFAIELHGDLDRTALQAAFDRLIERHQSLRTTFGVQNEEPVQIIHAEQQLAIELIDCRAGDAAGADSALRRQIESIIARPFDLGAGPLLRVHLIRLEPEVHLMVLTIHHIVTDGWSNSILISELCELYRAAVCGDQARLPELEIQYSDYALWQKKYLESSQLSAQLDYWVRQLEHCVPLELPTDRPRPAVQTYNGRLQSCVVATELTRKTREFCQLQGVSLYMMMLACFSVLLQRYASQDDISIGSPIANRNRAELENLVGFFVNTLVMRTDLSGKPDFLTLLQRVKQTTLAAFEHQDIPFEKLVEALHPQRDRSRSPLFQIMFAVQNMPPREFELTGLSFRVPQLEVQTVRFDLEVYVWEQSESLAFGFVYNTDLFEASTIERMSGHLQNLLQGALADPRQKISALPLLSAAELRQLEDWNRSASDYPRESTVAGLFERQAAATPDAVALEYGDASLTYGELEARANRLAHYLRSRGVGAGSRVGLMLARGAELVVATLGILKAGGAYLPLDLDYPVSRLEFMLADAEVAVLVSDSRLVERVGGFTGERVCLDLLRAELEGERADRPEPVSGAEDLAYVIYTSGSTGTPKGVEIPQRAILRLVKHTDYCQVEASDRVAQASTISFDAATFELWGALLNGARLVGIDKETFLNPRSLSRYLAEKSVSVMFVTTAVFNQVAREQPGAFAGLRCLMFGGEAVEVAAVRAVLSAGAPGRLLHVYGPTESTTFASWYEVESVADDAVTVPIGRPLANTTLHVLDGERQPVPVGVPGELYIGGDGLARGYLKRPELSAERFVERGGERLYRTGDKVRYRADGAIEFIGRYDHQVKLRGFRIELGEIESALSREAGIDSAVVMLREDEPGERRIAAYVVAEADTIERLSASHSGDHVGEWQTLYDETYGNVDATLDLTRNFTGWNSSYTGEPIPLAEMNEWLESTLARIGTLEPGRVLEIGCGTGLLLYRLAPDCERYVGTDFSAVAQRQLQGVVAASAHHRHVELWRREANDFSGVCAGDFDTVIINSVAQYFPSMDYLFAVLEAAVAALPAGGRIMVGDIRSLPLLKAYHASVQLHLSPDEASGGELLRNIQQHVEEENELVIEPAFFHALRARLARISAVEILLKRGRHHNELSAYRYDVLLHVEGGAAELPESGEWLDWGASGLSVAQLEQRLSSPGQDWLGVTALPNARVARDVALLERLQQGDGGGLAVGELKQRVDAARESWVEPDELWRLAAASGYELELSYNAAGTDGRMDALFRRAARGRCAGRVFWPQHQQVPERPWGAYGSNPLKGRLANELIPRLRRDLQRQLPDYMLPAVYVVLDALPLNANGKVERKALPVPGDVRASLGTEYTAPRGELEQQLARIWAEVLKLERVGIHDNFFDLGGHSLLATQVVSRIRRRLEVELPLAEMFGYPTVAELAPVVAALQGGVALQSEEIPRADRKRDLPLSFAQERLWFLDQLEPGGSAYNMPLALRLDGELDAGALGAALDLILRRHEALRTRFEQRRERPCQVIEDAGLELEREDLSALAADTRESALAARIEAEASRPFDLTRGPLLRCLLLRLAEREHVLTLTMHHIISDGWSLGILFEELGAAYAALARGEQPQLKTLPIQYADFSAWQRGWLDGEALESLLAYWREQLAGLETLELPTDRPRPATQSYRGAALTLDFEPEFTQRLDRFAQREGASLYMVCLAAFAALMHRYSGQRDIVLGSPIANRNRAELEGLIGFFVNTLVLRTDVSGNPAFDELLRRVRATALDAFHHQDLPFEKLVDELQPDRDRSRNPLFQVAFALQNLPIEPLRLAGLELDVLPRELRSARFDIECHVWQRGADLSLNLLYSTDLFDAATIERLVAHYRRLLEAMVANPRARIGDVNLLSAAELRQLEDWNRSASDYPRESTVAGLFERQAAATPDAVALEYGDASLTYGELEARANRLAHYLRSRGVGAGSRVGLMLARGAELVVATLGILKAGGAYLPLDLDYPVSRLEFMLADAEVAVLVSDSRLVERVGGFTGERVCLDLLRAELEGERADRPEPVSGAEDLAYVIYTSGSTGTPKGVEIPQRAILRLVKHTDYCQVEASDRVAQASTISFDAATFELWGALLNGARLVGIDKETFLNPRSLSRYLAEKSVSVMFVTTAVFNQVAREQPGAFAGLRCLMFGGEAVEVAAVRAVLSAGAPGRLLHVYGPTESTTFASWYEVESVADDAVTVPIGRPLANTTLHVLDGERQPVPVGVPGELYIGGDGLARGYLKRPELSAERFVERGGERLYRTGDKVRYRADGAIEFIGRYDHQVKLRGFRIELGEIESALSREAGIDSAVVMLREDEPGERRLVAYLAGAAGGVPTPPELRARLRARLPDYMLPAAFVTLDALPLNANGKVERAALPAPDDSRDAAGGEYAAPRGELEQQLAEIWAEVLKLERVGIHDNFFDLGGHSLLATQVVSRIRRRLEVELPLAEMFGQPTVAELAPVVAALQGGAAAAGPIPRVERDRDLPLSFAQERLWFLDQLEPGGSAYNMPLALRLDGELDAGALGAALDLILRRHEALRTRFEQRRERPCQVIEDAGLELEREDLSALAADTRESALAARIEAEASRPFDLTRGPLLRCLLLRLAEREHVLTLTMHHIISDGWSLGILFEELGAAYAALARGEQPQLKTLPIQYADFSAWQRGWLDGEALESLLAYWREQLAGLETLELPTDRPRPATQSYRGAALTLDLEPELAQRLEPLAQRQGASLFMVCLAAFATLMQRYSGQRDIVLGSPIANRNRAELEGLIGFFVNSLVLRIDVSGNPAFEELVERVRATALDAYQHQDLPFEKLVEELHPQRDRSRNPLFQVMFALQNSSRDALDLQGLILSTAGREVRSARFDMEWNLLQHANGLRVSCVYNTDLFDAATVQRMLRHFRQLLSGVAAAPQTRLAALSLLSAAELRQLEDWNRSASDYPRESTVAGLFERQAAATPDAVALEYGDASLTYGELEARANRLAHYLRSRGVGAGSRVGLMLARGAELVVATLGILKAGGAYLPLDLDYPVSRLEFMLADAEVAVLVSDSRLVERVGGFTGERVCLDLLRAELEGERADRPEPVSGAEDLAYVIYTSGSTGTPKGVEIPQRAILRLVKHTDYCQVEASDRVAQASTISFDAATFELWGALLNGARLVGIDKETFLNPRSLSRYLAEKSVSVMFVTTAVFNQVAREQPGAFAGLRCLMFGGEAVEVAAVRAVLSAGAPGRLLHVYGPTESTTFASWYEVESVADDAVTVPIGRPLANTTLHVLDGERQPVPVGVPGELYIGGDGLARGYLKRPELSAERFVERGGERLYRTGDKVRYRADGAIEFIGRYDHQVKLRGFRIELGEIESALSREAGIDSAVVMLREDEPGERRLVAYLAGAAGGVPTPPELRARLRARLPDYMLPAAFVTLDALPLNANGKVERAALPAPDDSRDAAGGEYAAPRGELEQQLAEIWAEVLKLERVGIHDNFFDLGGHSLLATQVVSRIRRRLEVELPLAEMFGQPTVAELAPVVAALQGGAAAAGPIPRVERDRDLPLSFAQERLWFLDQLEPESAAYIMDLSLRIKGKLRVDALKASLDTILRRHEALRTRFAVRRGKPVQVIEDTALELQQEDLSALSSAALDNRVLARIDAQARRPFDLAAGSLLRAKLLRLTEREHVLTLTMHHIISDGWSLGILFRELGECYAAFSDGERPALAGLPIQYADFAVWQRNWLSGEVLDAQLTYWREKLKDLATLELPTDRPRPAAQSYRGASEMLKLDNGLREQLETLSKRSGVTLFMTLLAGFGVLMHRYSAQDDIVVGSPIANRNRAELEGLIGFFVNMQVLRMDTSGNPDFLTLLGRVQETTLGAYQHQDIPFEKLVEVLQPERDRSRNPLFQVQFALQNAPIEPLRLSELTLEPINKAVQTTRFYLECHIWSRESGLDVLFFYNTDLFDAATVARMLAHYRNLLQSALAEPERRIDELAMLGAEERQQVLDWQRASAAYPADETVAGLFERQAAATPHATALEFEGERLTYAELEARANRLARYLQARGVGPEVLVGLMLERSLELVVAMLGIIKSGGAYLPLDPVYPQARLEYMLQDAQAPVLVTLSALGERVPGFAGERVCLDRDRQRIERERGERVDSGADAENMAYSIYTSGSTGQPKGVVVTHHNVCRLFAATEEYYGFGESDVWTLFHSSAFDFSVWEIWGALLHGGRLVIVPYATSRSPELFHDLLAEAGVTVLNQTPSAFNQLMKVDAARPAESLSALRLVIFGGEALNPQSLGPWFARHGERQPRLVNMYGITETTVHVSYRPLTASLAESGASVIGRALPDLQIYILDRYRQPVPVGVPGELYIGGAGLARGYLNRPELTAERFVDNPFGGPGERLYRSGDLARYRADGDIEYLGRGDEQVKIRGFRIELGEIESALSREAGIDSAVVMLREDEPGERRLVAYLAGAAGGVPAPPELRARLRARLPEYMLPAAFLTLDALPLNANGKVDRAALPAPDDSRDAAGGEYAAPQSELERRLALIWAEVLNLERVGIHDNFFDLGGHSLKLVELHQRLGDELEAPLSLMDLFEHPSIGTLVEHIIEPETPDGARSREQERARHLAAGGKRLQQLRQKRKRGSGVTG